MKQHNHAIVWIDHHEAKVFHFNADEMDDVILRPKDSDVHIHHKANAIGSGHAAEDKDYLHAVVEALGASRYVLLTGPGLAKTALMKHIAAHDPDAMDKIVAIETVDHPIDGALLKHARAYFRAEDLMTAQK